MPCTHHDYRDYMAKYIYTTQWSTGTQKISKQILANCGTSLDAFSTFFPKRLVDVSNIAKGLSYGKVENILEVIQEGIQVGPYIYISVAALNNIQIPYQLPPTPYALFNSFIEDVQLILTLLNRYDVWPIIADHGYTLFITFLDNNPEFRGYPFQETDLIRDYILAALKYSYLICLVGCEEPPVTPTQDIIPF